MSDKLSVIVDHVFQYAKWAFIDVSDNGYVQVYWVNSNLVPLKMGKTVGLIQAVWKVL